MHKHCTVGWYFSIIVDFILLNGFNFIELQYFYDNVILWSSLFNNI